MPKPSSARPWSSCSYEAWKTDSVQRGKAPKMPLLSLADHATFDATDEAGIILDTRAGVYFDLNVTATIMLQAALGCETIDQVVARLVERIDGSADTLRTGVECLVTELRARELLLPSATEFA